jgi:ATP/maltotriose-dependent transcriptional regulator MalT
LAGSVHPSPTLESLVADRIRNLGEREREAMELLAVAGQLGVDLVDRLVGAGVVDVLDEHGLVTMRESRRRVDVAVVHPVFAEVLTAKLPRTRSRRIRRRLTEVVSAVGARRRDDLVRIASWDVEGRGQANAVYLLQGARLALVQQELSTAESLARRVHELAPSAESAQVLAEVSFRRGEFEKVEALLSGQDTAACSERVRTALARRRATNLFYNLGELQAALAVIDRALEEVTDPAARRSLNSRRVVILAFGGLLKEALVETERLESETAGADRFEVMRARTMALTMAGLAERALPIAADARILHSALESDLGTPGLSVLLFTEATALSEVGRFRDARASIEKGFQDRSETTTRNWLRFATTRLELTTGYASRAQAAIEPVVYDSRGMGLGPIERWALTLLAMSCQLRGHSDMAFGHLAAAEHLSREAPASVFRYDSDRAFAWASAARGAVRTAHKQLLAAAERARRGGVSSQEAAMLHDVVRLGGAAMVADRLTDLGADMEGELIKVRAAHAAAAASQDATALQRVSEWFERLDCPLMAGEASNQAAGIFEGHLAVDTAAREKTRAQELSARAGASLTGDGSSADRDDLQPALSKRELEIATLAATGWSNQAIAGQLYVSVRTVGNHLQAVYGKLGVSGRRQLADALDPLPSERDSTSDVD